MAYTWPAILLSRHRLVWESLRPRAPSDSASGVMIVVLSGLPMMPNAEIEFVLTMVDAMVADSGLAEAAVAGESMASMASAIVANIPAVRSDRIPHLVGSLCIRDFLRLVWLRKLTAKPADCSDSSGSPRRRSSKSNPSWELDMLIMSARRVATHELAPSDTILAR